MLPVCLLPTAVEDVAFVGVDLTWNLGVVVSDLGENFAIHQSIPTLGACTMYLFGGVIARPPPPHPLDPQALLCCQPVYEFRMGCSFGAVEDYWCGHGRDCSAIEEKVPSSWIKLALQLDIMLSFFCWFSCALCACVL
jgi:hypothetical protein